MVLNIFIALLGAGFGSLVAWMLGASDREQARKTLAAQQEASEAQKKLAVLESQRNQFDTFARFVPRVQIVDGDKSKPYLILQADESFEVESMDYMTQNETTVASQQVGKTHSRIEVPINWTSLNEVRRHGPWVSDYEKSAQVIFRFHLRKDGQYKEHRHTGLAKQSVIIG
jgi:hypothetical protein